MKRRGLYYRLGLLCMVLLIGIVFKHQILKAFGGFLVYEDPLETADAIVVLAGHPMERGEEAASLYRKGYSQQIICTGETIPSDFNVIDACYPESELTRKVLRKAGVDSSRILSIHRGSSTREEAETILEYCMQKHLKKIIVLSSRFHTRRIHCAFSKVFRGKGTRFIIHPAPGSFSESDWWKTESGLITVNNEYVKLIYYFLKY